MPIKGFEIKAVEAKRLAPPGPQRGVRVDHNSTVTSIVPKGDDEAVVAFRFTATYGPLGFITVEGEITYRGDAEALVREWQENRKMPDAAAQEIHSAIIGNCITEAVVLAREVRLPPPIPLPQVNIQKYKPHHQPGPEVM
ncbi:MAG: hypothetical protein J7L61_04605 [Thermoplasmata archaeon]|nr:hypothetical protein [Thermoplasmata archaeon]